MCHGRARAHSTANAVVGGIRAAGCAGMTAANAHASRREISGKTMCDVSVGETSNSSAVMKRAVSAAPAPPITRVHGNFLIRTFRNFTVPAPY